MYMLSSECFFALLRIQVWGLHKKKLIYLHYSFKTIYTFLKIYAKLIVLFMRIENTQE